MQSKHDFSRRDFLRTAAALGAAPALAGVESAPAPAILAALGPGEAVHYGFIGTGTRGIQLLRFLTTIPSSRCVCACDIYPVNLKKGVEAIGSNPETCEDYRRLLDKKEIDAVFIATPLHLHAQMTLDALEAGKHVFIEKSMFFKEEESAKVHQTAAAHPKQILQVGLQRRSSVLYQVAMEMIRKGALGKVTFVRAQWHGNTNWRRPVADRKLERQINWRMYRDYSGGLMTELGSHQVDVANWAIGADPVSVVATGGIDYWKDGRETWDNVQAIFEYPGGQKLLYSSILSNAHCAFHEQIMGDLGTLEITIGKGMYFREAVANVSTSGAKEDWWAGATVTKHATQRGIPILLEKGKADREIHDWESQHLHRWLASLGIETPEELHDPSRTQLGKFFESIRDGKPIVAPLATGASDALAVIYANRAIDTGQRVFWPKHA